MKRFLLVACLSMVACSEGNLDSPKKFFSGNKIGSSSDFGLMKWGDDHVATFHGFADDLRECMRAAEILNKDACKETGGQGCLNPFSCKPLNH